MTFPMVTVQDVASSAKASIASGPFGSAIGTKFFVAQGVPVIRGNNLTLGKKRFVDDGFVFITEEKALQHRACIVVPDDIIFTAAGSLGQVGIIPRHGKHAKYFISNKQLKLTPDKERFDPLFLYYWFSSSGVRDHFIASNRGAAVPLITLGVLKSTPVPAPPLPTQQRIAAILSAYDDLIENNTRRIAVLEEMARRLYEEWFVHFRFPGHEEAEFDGDAEERLPKGWARTGLYDVADVVYGHPFKSGLFNTDGQGLGVVRIRDVMADRASASTTEEGKPQHRLSNGDILVGMDGAFYLGRWAGGDAWLNQRVCCLRPKPWMPRHLLFQTVANPIKRLEETIVGTTVAHLSARDMKQMQIVLPDQRGLDLATKHLEPSYGQILTLKRKNANLRAQRDMLLPKLISGEIDVSGAAELLEAAE